MMTDDLALNCVAYNMSQECFSKHYSIYGIEIGEEQAFKKE